MDRILKKNYYQVIEFMCMCNNQDRNYIRQVLSIGHVIEERHIKLAVIARLFGNFPIWSALMSSYKDFGRLRKEYFEKISNDRNILYEWLEKFIEDIDFADLKTRARLYWHDKLNAIEKNEISIEDLLYGKL